MMVDSGALVRVRLAGGGVVTGRLLATYVRGGPEIVLCETPSPAPCGGPGAPGARRLAVADVRTLAVRGRTGGTYGLFGFYLGMLAGVAADRHDTGMIAVPSGVALGALAGLVGSRVTGWIPLFPCGPHGPCGWRADRAAGVPPGR
jgi:hypothetical protein